MNAPTRLNAVPDEINQISGAVIGAAMEVHTELGPGFLARVYEDALLYEFRRRGIPYQTDLRVRVQFKDIEVGEQVLQIVVSGTVLVELVSVERVAELHQAQLVSHLQAARLPLGLLINFNVPSLRNGLYRRILSKHVPSSPRTSAHSATSAFSS
jgi:GxxExxY protein